MGALTERTLTQPASPGASGLFATERRRTALVLFVLMAALLAALPQRDLADSRYIFLVSHQLLATGTVRLEGPVHSPGFFNQHAPQELPPLPGRLPYQLGPVRGHIYYLFPLGTPVLVAPYVGFLELLGVSVLDADGAYNSRTELRAQRFLAAAAVAGFAVWVYLSGCLLLPQRWSLCLAVIATLGTSALSTASRVMWSQTTLIFLLAWACYLLLKLETSTRPRRPVLWGAGLATLLAWCYITRPTAIGFILAVTVFLALRHRRLLAGYLSAGALWAGLFLLWSHHELGVWLPWYYSAARFQPGRFGLALLGNLFSPARGFFIYTPMVLVTAWLLIRHRRRLPHRALVVTLLAAVLAHFLTICSVQPWWGGHSYGPRFMTDITPCLAALTIIGLRAWLDARAHRSLAAMVHAPSRRRIGLTGGTLLAGGLVAISVFMHLSPCLSGRSAGWNASPVNVDVAPGRLWDWSDPPFLRPFRSAQVAPPLRR